MGENLFQDLIGKEGVIILFFHGSPFV
jgi:hypothetical protein